METAPEKPREYTMCRKCLSFKATQFVLDSRGRRMPVCDSCAARRTRTNLSKPKQEQS